MSNTDNESIEEHIQRIRDEDFLDEPIESEKVNPYDDPFYDLESTEVAALIRNNQ